MTSKELSYVNDLLSQEEGLVKKYEDYIQNIQDPNLKTICNQLVSEHQSHYQKIYNTLGQQ